MSLIYKEICEVNGQIKRLNAKIRRKNGDEGLELKMKPGNSSKRHCKQKRKRRGRNWSPS